MAAGAPAAPSGNRELAVGDAVTFKLSVFTLFKGRVVYDWPAHVMAIHGGGREVTIAWEYRGREHVRTFNINRLRWG